VLEVKQPPERGRPSDRHSLLTQSVWPVKKVDPEQGLRARAWTGTGIPAHGVKSGESNANPAQLGKGMSYLVQAN